MKFPRNARIFRGQLDAAPFATVFFLLLIFMMLGWLVYRPGVPIRLPLADNLSGTDQPTIVVAVDANNRLYFKNQVIDETELRRSLAEAVKASPQPLTIEIRADQAASHGMLTRLELWARDAGITNGLEATLPRPLANRP
jgi:biopolymer transport protein ExbD